MFGHGWPEGLVEFGAGAVLDGVEGVVIVDGVVVVLGVDWVVVPVVPMVPLGAAAAPAIPATAPPVASAPTTMTALIIFALFMGTSCWSVGGSSYATHPAPRP